MTIKNKSKCPKCKGDTPKRHHLSTFEDKLCLPCLDERIKILGKFKKVDTKSDE